MFYITFSFLTLFFYYCGKQRQSPPLNRTCKPCFTTDEIQGFPALPKPWLLHSLPRITFLSMALLILPLLFPSGTHIRPNFRYANIGANITPIFFEWLQERFSHIFLLPWSLAALSLIVLWNSGQFNLLDNVFPIVTHQFYRMDI